jgi:integrase
VWRILRRRAELAGLEIAATERLSPHGMRAGFITEAYLHGALDEQVMAHARQKSIETTRRYRNRAKTVAASPTKLLDL